MGTFSVAPNKSKGAFEGVKSSENDQWKTSKQIIFQKINNSLFVGNPLKAPFDLFGATENVPMIQWLSDIIFSTVEICNNSCNNIWKK